MRKMIFILTLFAGAAAYAQTVPVTLQPVKGGEDYKNVTVVFDQSLKQDLNGIDEVSVIGYASKPENATKKAIISAQVQAAMMGANLVVVSNKEVTGAAYADGAGRVPASTSLRGYAYTNTVLDTAAFNEKIAGKTTFHSFAMVSMNRYGYDLRAKQKKSVKQLKVDKISKRYGQITIHGDLEGNDNIHYFRVIYFNETYFTIYYRGVNKDYNIKILF